MVGIRARAVPRFPDGAFGNCITSASAVVTSSEKDDEGALVPKLRATMRGVDDNYINRLLDHVNPPENNGGDSFKPENCAFTSWLRFPVYEFDFGWGKRVWVVVLMDSPCGDGVEAWVNVPN